VSLLDLILVVMVGLSVATAFMAGFARAGIGFFAAIAGVLFGLWFYGIPAASIQRFVGSPTVSNVLGFFVVFLVFAAAGGLIGKLLSHAFKWTGLSWLDRLFGAAFGVVRGVLIAVAFVAVLMAFTPRPLPNYMVDSKLLPYVLEASDVCAALAPRSIKEAFRESVAEIRRVWDEQVHPKPKPELKKRED
jgi:membrane protein required for colicin V production